MLSGSAGLMIFLYCTTPLKSPADITIYRPQIVFAGTVSDEYDSLPGNAEWPNTCTLKGDTVHMTFFSENFVEVNKIRQGDFLRIEVLPCSTCTTGVFSTRNIILHMARYQSTNFSWEIVPRDTIGTQNSVRMTARSFSRQHGAAIAFEEIGANASAMTGSLILTIYKGRISGTIE
jgi:hypothetical protein